MKASITNTSRAPQGVYAVTGLVFIEPGQSRYVDVAEDYAERVKALPFLDAKWDSAPAPKAKAPAPAKAAAAPSDLSTLRKDYKDAFGKGPSPKWDADTLKAKIAAKASAEPISFDDMTDTELKTFLGEKGVATTDETREQLVELAKAA